MVGLKCENEEKLMFSYDWLEAEFKELVSTFNSRDTKAKAEVTFSQQPSYSKN